MNTKNRGKSGIVMLAAAMLGMTLVAGLFAAPAGSLASPAYKVEPPHVVSIPANGKVTLKARGFCMEFGKPFPTGATAPNGLADAKIRSALTYAIDKGYADGNAQQVQLAIWNLRDGTWHNTDHVVASEIVSNTTATPPTANALALTDAITQKSVEVSAVYVPQTADAFYGDGNIVVTNTTSSALNVYMPIGTVFTVPNGGGKFQDLVAYELVQAEGTPTAAATSTVAATRVTDPTSTVVTMPTAQATATTEVATPQSTTTTAPTVEVATPTPAPVVAPLPQTGDSGAGTGMVLVLAVGLVMASLGLLMRLKKA
jgi:hypothetical protein